MHGRERCTSTLRVEFWAWFLSWLPCFLCPHAATRPLNDETASVRRAQALPSDTIPDTRDRRRNREEGMDHREREWEMAQIDADMGMEMDYRDAGLSQPLHTDPKALRVAITAGAVEHGTVYMYNSTRTFTASCGQEQW
ncbi:hypothetical protein B0H13DRAFT_1932887 [Mycena leptocephala]|nr:hypothetical protein B0H13DRAFT_1932887 [Mycena leptocephala]